MPTVTFYVGLAGSGKTHWSEKLQGETGAKLFEGLLGSHNEGGVEGSLDRLVQRGAFRRQVGPSDRHGHGDRPGRRSSRHDPYITSVTIRGHVFCSFLAVVLLKELYRRLEQHGWKPEWKQLRDDLESLEQFSVRSGDKSFVIRSDAEGEAGKAVQAVGVSLGPVVKSMTSIPAISGERSANAPG